MLPDRSVLIVQKLVENAKIKKFQCDILSDFQTMCKYEIDPERLQSFFYVILGMMKVFFFHFSKVSVDILFRVTFGTSLPRMLA